MSLNRDQIVGGNYRIVRLLGQGGMGAVYEVEHTQLGVHYALKTFTFEGGHDELLKNKFLAEGKVLARLQDPHLVRVFDLNYDEAIATLYFVMDLVLYKDGEPHTLADVETDDLEESYILQWFGELASALDYIHAQGIVHRDIKLNNVLLNADKKVILSDFGVSRFFSQNLRNEINAVNTMVSEIGTNGHVVMGTQGYMAPEVERGEEATPAADVYSLGVMLMYLLTGIWYDSGSKVLKFLDTLEYRWKDILPQMLAENPKDRPTNLTRLVKILGPVKSEAQTVIRAENPASMTVGRGLRPRRTRTILIAASLVFVVAFISVVVLVLQPGKETQTRSQRPVPAQIQPPSLTDGEFSSFFGSRGVYEVQK